MILPNRATRESEKDFESSFDRTQPSLASVGTSGAADRKRVQVPGFNEPAGLRGVFCRYAVPLSLAMAAMVFFADFFTPLGVASGVPYSLAVLAALCTRSRRYVVAFAVLCSLLTIADLFTGPGRGGSELWKVLTNRTMAIFMIWITTTLGVMRQKAEQRRREAEALTRLHLDDLAHMGRIQTAGQLATSLAHELNQPLAAITLQSEIAAQLAQNGVASRRHAFLDAMTEITEQSQRAGAIIKSLREMVRKADPQESPVDLNVIVREVARLIDAQARHAGVTVQLKLVHIPPVIGDRVQLEQVLLNLLQNSLDAIDVLPAGPRIHIQTARGKNGTVEISVSDTGIGIPDGDAEQVFERFYTSKPNGMGMGLAICRSIIEAHGGEIWAARGADGGASFCVRLPTTGAPSVSP